MRVAAYLALVLYIAYIGVEFGRQELWLGVAFCACISGWWWSNMWKYIDSRKENSDASSG